MTKQATQPDSADRFVERVEKLDNGALAQLRRAAGDRLHERPELLWFAGVTRGPESEGVDFLVATLLAQYSTATIRARGHRANGNFGRTWKLAIGPAPSESIRRRFDILLNSDLAWDGGGDLPYRLRQMVRYAAAHGVGVDWPQLLRDLRRWPYAEKRPQKEWARSFFSGTPDSDTED